MLQPNEHPDTIEVGKSLTHTQQEALRVIAFFRRQRKVGRGWLVGDKHLSEKLVARLEQLDLVEQSAVNGRPVLQLTIVGEAIKGWLLQ
jgi:predicted nicotinamide N-methyase